jgi:hypothetical protein
LHLALPPGIVIKPGRFFAHHPKRSSKDAKREVATVTSRRLLLVALAILIAGLVWWLGSPLFLDETVDEDFPMTVSAEIPDSMTRSEVEALMMTSARSATRATEPMPESGELERLREGEFRDVDRLHRGSGSATIYRLPGGEHVLRLEDFEVTNGPDLRVLLAAHADPMSRSELDGSGYVELAPLKGNVGNQNYPIPSEVEIAEQGSVVIYCRPFHVLFSVAPLR